MSALLLALGLGAGLAWAQQETAFTPEGASCGEARPIAGTAGLRNAQSALQTNANTYAASAFAARNFVSTPRGEADDDAWHAKTVIEYNATFGAARVPVYHPAAVTDPTACIDDYRVAVRPYDLQAGNIGFSLRRGRTSLLYATSLTYAAPSAGDQFFRILMSGFVAPPYVLAGAGLSPVIDLMVPGTLDFGAARLDYVVGLTTGFGTVDVAAGYLGSRGGYLNITEQTLGAYAFGALPQGRPPILEAGVDRLQPGGQASSLGMTSAAYQQLPFLQDGDASPEAPAPLLYQLRVGSLQQENLLRVLDVGARYRIEPSPAISELGVGLHTPDFHAARGDRFQPTTIGVLARGGFVTTPAAWAEGNGPERLPSARLEGILQGDGGRGSLALLYNDPDQLQLYPFARGAFSYQFFLGAEF